MRIKRNYLKIGLNVSRLFCICVLTAILCLAVVGTQTSTVYAHEEYLSQTNKSFGQVGYLSQLSENEAIQFLVESEVEIPDGFIEIPGFGEFILNIFRALELNPNHPFPFSVYRTHRFAEDIRGLINDVNVENAIIQEPHLAPNAHILMHNLVFGGGEWRSSGGDWNWNWLNFNCYSFAINRTEQWWHPGEISGTPFPILLPDVFDLALRVRDDLVFLGYHNVRVKAAPPANLTSDEILICIRTGWGDFHLMKFNQDSNFWYHKPGNTAILRYLHHPDYMNWPAEFSFLGVEFFDPLFIYDSAIYYIVFSKVPPPAFQWFTVPNSTGLTITGIVGQIPNSLDIPAQINGVNVTQIGFEAFANNRDIRNIIIPNTITTIGDRAFANATNLRGIVNFTSNPQIINNTTFQGVNTSRIMLGVSQGMTQAFINAGWHNFIIIEQHLFRIIKLPNGDIEFLLLFEQKNEV